MRRLAHAFVSVLVRAQLAGFDRTIEEGCGRSRRAPLDRADAYHPSGDQPGLGPRAGFLAFTLSLDDLVIASFVTGPSANNLARWRYSRACALGVSPEVNALATLFSRGSFSFWWRSPGG